MRNSYSCSVFVAAAFFAGPLLPAQIGGDGSDGDLRPTEDMVLDTSARPGGFNFGAIVIPTGVTVQLVGTHAAILRAQGEARIDGTLSAEGERAVDAKGAAGGPGGFAGGHGGDQSQPDGYAGMGPGAGLVNGEPAAHGGFGEYVYNQSHIVNRRVYGSARPFDLRGGSGSAGWACRYDASGNCIPGSGGYGGGGTIALLADGPIHVAGTVSADAANLHGLAGFGAGGSIQIRSLTEVTVSGRVLARGTQAPGAKGGYGFVRIDAWSAPPRVSGLVSPSPLTLTLPGLEEAAAPRIGQPWHLQTATFPGDVVGYFVAFGPADITLPPFGRLGLDPGSMLWLGTVSGTTNALDTEAMLTVPVPGRSELVGVPLWVQSLAVGHPGPGPRLSNTLATRIGQ